ncbi:hypothetical protein P8452_19793 [Trifolium repens]|nr:hypothetical protein P8452_19793 [Trifolium repens]
MEPSQQPTPPVVVKQEPIRNQDNSPSPVFENPESSIIDRKPKSCGVLKLNQVWMLKFRDGRSIASARDKVCKKF